MGDFKVPAGCEPPAGLPEKPLAYCVEHVAFGKTSFSITHEMTTPTGSPHVRGAAFYLPRLTDIPSLSTRIISHAGSALLIITSVKINEDVGGWMQIAIAAQSFDGSPAHGKHFCNIVAIGRERVGPTAARRAKRAKPASAQGQPSPIKGKKNQDNGRSRKREHRPK